MNFLTFLTDSALLFLLVTLFFYNILIEASTGTC